MKAVSVGAGRKDSTRARRISELRQRVGRATVNFEEGRTSGLMVSHQAVHSRRKTCQPDDLPAILYNTRVYVCQGTQRKYFNNTLFADQETGQ